MANSWGYKKENGPWAWHNYFPIAETGARQSPINIVTSEAVFDSSLKNIQVKYTPSNVLDVENTGASFKVNVDGNGSELTGASLGSKYALLQFHAHWGRQGHKGSEHQVDGKMFDGELHLVHWNTAYGSPEKALEQPDGLAVLGIFLKMGEHPHPEFQKVIDTLPDIKLKGDKAKLSVPIDPIQLLPIDTTHFWTYEGSLTTPPLLEIVSWIVFQEPIELSENQFHELRKLQICTGEVNDPESHPGTDMVDNYRPPVPTGNRTVKTTIPKKP